MSLAGTVLVTGAAGQIGSELTYGLYKKYGKGKVVGLTHSSPPPDFLANAEGMIFEKADVRNMDELEAIITKHNVEHVYHLAAMLSKAGEGDPMGCWDLNVNSTRNILELARKEVTTIKRVLIASSCAVYGPSAPKSGPNTTYFDPGTMYGVTKVTGELLSNYYFNKFGVDVRGIRYSGTLTVRTIRKAGGSTDYAPNLLRHAQQVKRGTTKEPFVCPIAANQQLGWSYMDDAVAATIQLMEAEPDKIKTRTAYTIQGFTMTPEELINVVKEQYCGELTVKYEANELLQKIFSSIPTSYETTAAHTDWGFVPQKNREEAVKEAIRVLEEQA